MKLWSCAWLKLTVRWWGLTIAVLHSPEEELNIQLIGTADRFLTVFMSQYSLVKRLVCLTRQYTNVICNHQFLCTEALSLVG